MKGSFAACSIVGNVASPLSADMAAHEDEHFANEGEVMLPAPTRRTALGMQVKADAPLAMKTLMEDIAKRLRRMAVNITMAVISERETATNN